MNNIKWITVNNKYNITGTFSSIFKKKYSEFCDKTKILMTNINYKYDYDDDIVIVKKDNNIKYKFKYLFIGLYNTQHNIWYWCWNVPFINKKFTTIKYDIKELKNYLTDNFSYFNPKEADEYYYYVSNKSFYLKNDNVYKLIEIAMSIKDCCGYLEIKNENTIEYLLITNIVQIN